MIHKILSLFKKNNATFEESVTELIEESDNKQDLNNEKKELLYNLLESYNKKISEVMTPRKYIVALEYNSSFDDVKKHIQEHGHTRLPVYKDNLDTIVGFIHIKNIIDNIDNQENFKLQDIIKDILFVPLSMKVVDLITQMRTSRVHIAIVMDEYGGVDGLITIEDLLEEIVGDIEDDCDIAVTNDQYIVKKEENKFEASGNLPIEQFKGALNIELDHDSDNEYETIGGLICDIAGCVPQKGSSIPFIINEKDYQIIFEIVQANERFISKVNIVNNN